MRFLFCCCWLLCLPFAHAAERWQNTDYLLQAFEDVALKQEYQAGDAPVKKWQQPVKVWVIHHTDHAAQHQQLLEMHLRHLAALTGHPIQLASQASEANLTVAFSHLQLWHNEIALLSGNLKLKPPADALCMFGMQVDRQFAIQRAWVVIPVDLAEEHRGLVSCIVEELTQAMGLPNDAENVYPSIFNDKTPEVLLTGLDALLLKMLYSPTIKPGMQKAQLRPLLQSLLLRWQADGTIANAEKAVRQSELYDMMGF